MDRFQVRREADKERDEHDLGLRYLDGGREWRCRLVYMYDGCILMGKIAQA
jgi:hypothetical protein